MYANGNYEEVLKNTNFNVAIYLRLSREDEVIGQSESIVNQKNFVTKYVIDNGWNIYDTYIDDGYSGTNFERPDFQRMIADIELKNVNLVIVKDSSRFGRDYIETGYYLEKYFPLKNVRFIAINDNIDTFNDNGNNDIAPFKSIINDMYAKDISKKIKTTINTKRHNGDFIGAFAPYGYIKSPSNKNKFLVDENTAPIVKRIFTMYVNGTSMCKIAKTFNEEGILCPCSYKQETSNYQNVNVKFYIWRNETIKRILTNPTYKGCMAQRRQEKISYKSSKFRKIPMKNWIVVDDTHEAIIDKETFNTVQEMLKKNNYGSSTDEKKEHLLSGLMFCSDCGYPITYRRDEKKRFRTLCSNNSRFGKCKRHFFLEDEIEQKVINDLKSISKQVLKDEKAFITKIERPKTKEQIDLKEAEVKRINKRLEEIKNTIKALFESKIKNIVTDEDFINMSSSYNKEREQLNNRLHNLQGELQEGKQNNSSNDNFYNAIKELTNFTDIKKSILVHLIDRIEVSANGEVKIYYKFSI